MSRLGEEIWGRGRGHVYRREMPSKWALIDVRFRRRCCLWPVRWTLTLSISSVKVGWNKRNISALRWKEFFDKAGIRYRYRKLELPKASFPEQSFGKHKRALRIRKTSLISCHCGDTRMCWYGSAKGISPKRLTILQTLRCAYLYYLFSHRTGQWQNN